MHIPTIVRLEGPGGQEIRGEWKVLEVSYYPYGVIEKIVLVPLVKELP